MGHVNPLQLIILGLLAVVAVTAVLARRLSIAYPILLVIAGLLCSLLPHLPRISLSPDLVFFVFLPPLLYSAAWQTSWREFRYHMLSIGMLAIGLVVFTAVGVALTAHFLMPGFDWRLGFMLGAIVSPTDAVAAVSIARRVKMPHAVTELLEGESLINDATGLLALQFGLEMITGGSVPPLGRSLLEFLWLLGGGIGVGLVIGWITTRAESLIHEGSVDTAVSLIVAYVSYLAGETVGASGVIAVVVCGLYLSRRSDRLFSAPARLQVWGVWAALDYLLNGLVFLLIGLQLHYVLQAVKGYSLLKLSLYGFLFSLLLLALRMVWVFPSLRLATFLRCRVLHQGYKPPSPKATFVLGWTGMRGVVALAAAASLPITLADGQPFPQRGLILFLTFAVIFVTLVLQGLSLPAVVRAMGFDEDGERAGEEEEARRRLLQAAMQYLENQRDVDSENGQPRSALYDEVMRPFQLRMRELQQEPESGTDRNASRHLLLRTYQAQRDALILLRSEGSIGDGVYRSLERELDLVESRLDSQV